MEKREFTSASASKFIRSLEDEKERLLARERENATYVLAQDEEEDPPSYDYQAIFDAVDELDRKVRLVRHALNLFNAVTIVPDEGITIDEVLILLAQMNGKLRRLGRLRSREPKKRLSSGYYSSSKLIEYEYANYDVERASEDYNATYERVAELQLRLDLVNQTKTFSVEL